MHKPSNRFPLSPRSKFDFTRPPNTITTRFINLQNFVLVRNSCIREQKLGDGGGRILQQRLSAFTVFQGNKEVHNLKRPVEIGTYKLFQPAWWSALSRHRNYECWEASRNLLPPLCTHPFVRYGIFIVFHGYHPSCVHGIRMGGPRRLCTTFEVNRSARYPTVFNGHTHTRTHSSPLRVTVIRSKYSYGMRIHD